MIHSLKKNGSLLWALVLGIICAGSTLHPIYDGDTLMHLVIGRAVLESRSWTVLEPLATSDFPSTFVAPAWLWELINYGIYQMGSFGALHIFLVCLTVLASLIIVQFLSNYRTDETHSSLIVVSTLLMSVVMSRMLLRPESFAIILMPIFLILCERFITAQGKTPMLICAAALFLIEVLWAQVHGSFILAPAIFGIFIFGNAKKLLVEQKSWFALAVFLALTLGVFTSAHGLNIFNYIVEHNRSPMLKYIDEMQPSTWKHFNPVFFNFGSFYFYLWTISVLGMFARRSVCLVHLLLGLMGLWLGFQAIRFLVFSSILLAPLAYTGAASLIALVKPKRVSITLSLGIVILLSGRKYQLTELESGPIGQLGLPLGKAPIQAITYLERWNMGRHVLTDYDGSSAIGVLSQGRIKTFIDSRTPMYYDETDFISYFRAAYNKQAMKNLVTRYGFTAIVAPRTQSMCFQVPSSYFPAIIETEYTTFVPTPFKKKSAQFLSACGEDFFTESACRISDAEAASMIQHDTGGDSSLASILYNHWKLRCRDSSQAISFTSKQIKQIPALKNLMQEHNMVLAIKQNHLAEALKLINKSFDENQTVPVQRAWSIIIASKLASPQKYQIVKKMVADWGEHTPIRLKAEYARLCLSHGDYRTSRYYAMQAAMEGDLLGTDVIRALSNRYPDPRVQSDLKRWTSVFNSTISPKNQ